MMIHKLAKVISAATVLTMTAYFVPESALAGLGRFPGPSTAKVEFNLDITSSVSTSDGANQTIFQEAIQKPTYQNNFNSIVPDVLNFNPGEVKISLIDLTPEFLQTLNTADSSFKGKFDSKAVKYEASLEDNSNNLNFAYYAPYTVAN